MHCHFCGGKLEKVEIGDVFFEGSICQNGHQISSRLKKYSQDEYWKAKGVKVDKSGKAEILREWLGNPDFRIKLPDQFCELLRAELDLTIGNQLNTVISGYNNCPMCSEKLNPKKSDDVWVANAECKNGHTWWTRHQIWSQDKSYSQQLDITHETYLTLRKFYKESKEHRECIPDQLWDLI